MLESNFQKYILSKESINDIEAISYRISEYNINSAKWLVEEFFEMFEVLSDFPFMGSVKIEFTSKNYRWVHIEGYWIAYNHNLKPIEIVRIISSHMDIPNRL